LAAEAEGASYFGPVKLEGCAALEGGGVSYRLEEKMERASARLRDVRQLFHLGGGSIGFQGEELDAIE